MRPPKEDPALLEAALTAVDVPLHYANRGQNLVMAVMGGTKQGVHLAHYPDNDVVDQVHHTRFYYHSHRHPNQEHGHFHLFVNDQGPGNYMHLAALAVSPKGEPVRWFSTNAWVTGELMPSAAQLLEQLALFQVHTSGRLAPVARWLTAMVRLFRPQLIQMILRRDAILQRRTAHQAWSALCQDRRLDVLSQCSASLHTRIQQFQQRGF